jgi:hypothetical protein
MSLQRPKRQSGWSGRLNPKPNSHSHMGKKEKHGPGPPSLSQGKISKFFSGKVPPVSSGPKPEASSVLQSLTAPGVQNAGAAEWSLVVGALLI